MPFWAQKKVVIPGGAGFVGSHLVERLVESDAIVRVPIRSRERADINLRQCKDRIELVEADLMRMDACKRVMEGMDIALNLAAEVGGTSFFSWS